MGRRAYDRMLRDEKLLPYTADDLVRMWHIGARARLGRGGWLAFSVQPRPGPVRGRAAAAAGSRGTSYCLLPATRCRAAPVRRRIAS